MNQRIKLIFILFALLLVVNCQSGDENVDKDDKDDWFKTNGTRLTLLKENKTKIEILNKILDSPVVIDIFHRTEKKLTNFTKRVKWNIKAFIEEAKGGMSDGSVIQLKNTLVALIDSMELSPLCLMSFVMMKRALAMKERWPLKYYDSMEILPPGLLDGRLTSFGQYDQCLSLENSEFKGLKFRGQYCLAKVPLSFLYPVPNNSTLAQINPYDLSNDLLKLLQAINYFKTSHYRFGICIPSTCSPKEINRALNKIMTPSQKKYVEIEKECKVIKQEHKKNGYQRTAQSILVTLCMLVAISTSVELYFKLKRRTFGRRKTLKKSLLVFSAIQNTKILFKRDDRRLNVIDTILIIFISLEFLGRTYIMPVVYNLIGLQRASKGLPRQYFRDKKFFWMRNSSFSMTVFILMSSIVLSYKLCAIRGKSKYNPLNYLKYLVNRYLSLFRRIIGPLLLIYLIPLWTEGPLWHYYEPLHAKPCKDNLLASLLFYNNYMPGIQYICNLPSATFSAIFQYQIFAPIILLLISAKLFGYITLVLLVFVGCFLSIVRRVFFDFKIAPFEVIQMDSVPEISHSFFYYLGSAEQNISTFIIGLVVGYLIQRKPNLRLFGRKFNLLLWALFAPLPQIASYWAENFKALEGGFSTTDFLVWFFTGRVLWALGYGWVVYACSTGRGGYVTRVLSQPLLQPLARLSFGIYLNHMTIIGIRQLAIRDTYLLTHSQVFENVIIDYMIAIAIAYFFYIVIECPIYHLIKIINGQTVDAVIDAKQYEDSDESDDKLEENIEIKLFDTKNIEL